MFRNLFKLDLRSLALARVLLGITAFFDIGRRFWDLEDFFTDGGLLSRADFITNYETSWRMSLLNLNGSYSFALIIMLAGLLASITYTLGWRTKLSNFITWMVIISFQGRFPEAATSGGDMLLRIFLLWSIFLPMNAKYSMDHAVENKAVKQNEYFSVFTMMWIVQIFLLYFFTFLYKWAPVYHTTFEAVWYMLQLDVFTTPFGKWLGQHYQTTRVLSLFSYALELIGPLMIMIPFKRDFFRGAAVFSFWCFHLGIAATLHLGNFVPICLILWVGMIPTTWWNYLEEKFRSSASELKTIYYNAESEFARKCGLIAKELLFLHVDFIPAKASDKYLAAEMLSASRIKPIRRLGLFLKSEIGIYLTDVQETGEVAIGTLTSSQTSNSKIKNMIENLFSLIGFDKVRLSLSKFEKIFGAFILTLIVAWNIEGYVEPKKWHIGSPFDEIMFTLHTQQGWAMFAPHPQRSDGWWVMDGKLSNGKTWDALNNRDVTFDRPQDIYGQYSSEDWRKFLDNLQGSRDESYLLLLGKHLCRKWNAEHPGEEALTGFQLYFMQEFTNSPQEPPAKVEKLRLWNHSCF